MLSILSFLYFPLLSSDSKPFCAYTSILTKILFPSERILFAVILYGITLYCIVLFQTFFISYLGDRGVTVRSVRYGPANKSP